MQNLDIEGLLFTDIACIKKGYSYGEKYLVNYTSEFALRMRGEQFIETMKETEKNEK